MPAGGFHERLRCDGSMVGKATAKLMSQVFEADECGRAFRSWLSLPQVASDEFFGFLSAGHTDPDGYFLQQPQSRMPVCIGLREFTA